jgi:signal transduction histidine kinase
LALVQEMELVSRSPVVQAILRSVGGLVAVLDSNRQILAVNEAMAELLAAIGSNEPFSLRTGEVLNCVYAHDLPAGCGTTKRCATCGAATAIVGALATEAPVEQDCAMRVTRGGQETDLLFRVRSVPIAVEGARLLLLFLQDVTRAAERAALERSFFHDVNNLLLGLDFAVNEKDSEERERALAAFSLRLRRELDVQRVLVSRVGSDVRPSAEAIDISALTNSLSRLLAHHPSAAHRILAIEQPLPARKLWTDPVLLQRVLFDMLLNAFEATPDSGGITLSVVDTGASFKFSVTNPGEIPPPIQLRLFQKHFTTKQGEGRGLGTFGMKLFGETFLRGRVSFVCTNHETTFVLELAGTPGTE